MIRAILTLAACSLLSYAANPPVGAGKLVLSGTPEAARFSAVGRFGGCTAFAMSAAGAAASSPAYILTAGHCIDLSANGIVTDRADTTRAVVFRYLVDAPASARLSFRARRVVYSTMKAMDFALLELDATLGALTAAGIAPYTLSPGPVSEGERVEWAGIPSNSIPFEDAFLRTSGCTVSGATDVVEWRWLWRNMLRHDCSDIFGGASGSPLFSAASAAVIGVVTTGNVGFLAAGPDFECWRDNPCEVASGGYTYRPNSSYASPTAPLAACFDSAGLFSLATPGCGLDPGVQASVLSLPIRVRPGTNWDAAVTSDVLRYFRYKIVHEGFGDCRTEEGYGAPLPIAGTVRIRDPLPAGSGRYHLCVVAGLSPTPGDGWQQTRFATVVYLTLDDTPAESIPEIQLLPATEGFLFTPSYRPPDLSLLSIKLDSSPTGACGDAAGYRDIFAVPLFISREITRLCIRASDLAGNSSPIYEVDLRNPSILPAGILSAAGQELNRLTPGGWATILGVNFGKEGAEVKLVDSAGESWSIAPAYASPAQVNFVVPAGVAIGPATVSVRTPASESLPRTVSVEPVLPGLFTPNGVRYGFAAMLNAQPVAPTDTLIFVAGGLGPDVSIEVSGVPLEVLDVAPSGTAGAWYVTARLPAGTVLRGYLPVAISSAGRRATTPVYLWMR